MRVGLAAICLLCASPLNAADGSTTVTVDVQANVAARCGIAAIGSRQNDAVAIDSAQALTFSFNLDCNTGFRIGVRAAHGALRLTTAPRDAQDLGGFGVERDYLVALTLSTDDSATVAAGQCSSRDLAQGAGTCPFFGRPRDGAGFSPGEESNGDQSRRVTDRELARQQHSGRAAAGRRRLSGHSHS